MKKGNKKQPAFNTTPTTITSDFNEFLTNTISGIKDDKEDKKFAQVVEERDRGVIINKELFDGFKGTVHINKNPLPRLAFNQIQSFKNIKNEVILPVFESMNTKPEIKALTIILSSPSINNKNAGLIIEGIMVNQYLTSVTLNFTQAKFTAQALAQVLQSNRNLTSVDFSHNSIGDEGAKYISDALKVNSTVTRLALENNDIKVKGAQYLASSFEINHVLKILNLKSNNINKDGVQAMSQALKNNHSVVSIEIDEKGLDKTVLKTFHEELGKNILQNSVASVAISEGPLLPAYNNNNNNNSSTAENVNSTTPSTFSVPNPEDLNLYNFESENLGDVNYDSMA